MSVALLRQPTELQELRERVSELEETVRQLTAPPARTMQLPEGLHLTRVEMSLLGMLHRSSLMTLENGFAAVRAVTRCGNFSDNALKVHIYHLRKKLTPLGVEIACVWGVGYRLDEAAKAILAGWIA